MCVKLELGVCYKRFVIFGVVMSPSCRCGAAEPHTVAAFLGGTCAHTHTHTHTHTQFDLFIQVKAGPLTQRAEPDG